MTKPTLFAEDLRIDIDHVPSIDGLGLQSDARRVLLFGAPRCLFEALIGLRQNQRGRLEVLGVSSDRALREKVVVGVAQDPPMPARWTPLEYVTWSARLANMPAAVAKTRATEALGRAGLNPDAPRLGGLPIAARRATSLAAALVTGAKVIALEDPVMGLPDEVAYGLANVFLRALEDCAWILVAARVPLTSPFVVAAEDALVLSGSRVVSQGAPAELATSGRRYVLRLHGAVDGLASRLEERGAKLTACGAQATLDLGAELGTSEFLGICLEASVVVVEMFPTSPAFT